MCMTAHLSAVKKQSQSLCTNSRQSFDLCKKLRKNFKSVEEVVEIHEKALLIPF